LVPALVTSIWTTIMGGLGAKMEYTAMEMGLGTDCLYNATNSTMAPISNGTITRLSCADVSQQMFILIEHYPMAQFFSVLGLVGILGYFVTSSDSASFVIDMITSNGMVESPKIQRIFWALSEGAAATALLAAGGTQALTALQTASIAAAFPFCILLIIMVWSLLRAFEMDDELLARRESVKQNENEIAHSPKGINLDVPKNIHEQVKSDSDSIMSPENICSNEIPNGDEVHSELQPKMEPKKKPAEWNLGFFDGLCCKYGMVEACFCPCLLMHPVGQKVGMYSSPFHGTNLCTDILWLLAVLGLPFAYVVMNFVDYWQDGMYEFALVVWTIFMIIGAVHRMKVREHYNLPGHPVTDLAAYCCCYCLAVRQESLQCKETVLL
jgi:Cys-rich protein (TIGR01571 family)